MTALEMFYLLVGVWNAICMRKGMDYMLDVIYRDTFYSTGAIVCDENEKVFYIDKQKCLEAAQAKDIRVVQFVEYVVGKAESKTLNLPAKLKGYSFQIRVNPGVAVVEKQEDRFVLKNPVARILTNTCETMTDEPVRRLSVMHVAANAESTNPNPQCEFKPISFKIRVNSAPEEVVHDPYKMWDRRYVLAAEPREVVDRLKMTSMGLETPYVVAASESKNPEVVRPSSARMDGLGGDGSNALAAGDQKKNTAANETSKKNDAKRSPSMLWLFWKVRILPMMYRLFPGWKKRKQVERLLSDYIEQQAEKRRKH